MVPHGRVPGPRRRVGSTRRRVRRAGHLLSTTGPRSRLLEKDEFTQAKLRYLSHALAENRNGSIVDVETARATGRAKWEAAKAMVGQPHAGRHPRRRQRPRHRRVHRPPAPAWHQAACGTQGQRRRCQRGLRAAIGCCGGDLGGGRGRCRGRSRTDLHGLVVGTIQFSACSAGTRSNSARLLVTSTSPSLRAWAAI